MNSAIFINKFKVLIFIAIASIIFLGSNLYAECSDLDSLECSQWVEYCEWNEETGQCQEIGGGNGNIEFGPYQYSFLTESDGIRVSTNYNGALLYYPINGITPFASMVIIDAFDDEYGLQNWAEYYASHGFIAMTIGNFYNDYWDYEDRGIGLLDAVITIKHENERIDSPLFGMIDTTSFAVSGYSTGGGGAHAAATMDSTLNAVILHNPAVAFLDSLNCNSDTEYYCLVPEHLNHSVPVLVFAGEYELDELVTESDSIYANIWAFPQYDYVPETTDKVYFESISEGHGSSVSPVGEVATYAISWLNYYLLNDSTYCDLLIQEPESTSQFFTTIECTTSISYDINDDGFVNAADLVMLVTNVMNGLLDASDFNYDQNINIYDVLLLSDYIGSI